MIRIDITPRRSWNLAMARKPRLEYSGAIYHVMSRGNHGEGIFRTDADREDFLSTLGEVCGRTGWRIHAYVLKGSGSLINDPD